MNSLTDQQLLREYADRRSEAAFAELVRRHVDFVYSAALRMVCDAQLAEDVTQGAFLALAQNAHRLSDCPAISGWLHRTAQNLAAKTVRTDVRRRAREQEAAAMNELLSAETDATWNEIAPHLDAALGALSDADRDALVLRYFERKSALEMAQTLGVSAEAAQKRVSRAVVRVREFFVKRGVTVGASGLIVLISANAVQAAPVGLAASISTASVLAGSACSTSTAIAATKTLVMTTLQKTLLTVVIATSLALPLLVQRHARETLGEQARLLRQRATQLDALRAENEGLSRLLAQPKAAQALPNDQAREVLRLRGEVGRLQAALKQQLARPGTNDALSRQEVLASLRQLYVDRVNGLKQQFLANPAEAVPELRYLTERDWIELVTYDHRRIDPDNLRARSNARSRAQVRFVDDHLEEALKRYGKESNGRFPTELSELIPYFDSPVEDSVLQRWAIFPARRLPDELQKRVKEPWVITQKAPVDAELDQRMVIGFKTTLQVEGANYWGLVP